MMPPPRQLRLLAEALCREQLVNSNGVHEWDAKTKKDRQYLRISDTHARIITLLPYALMGSWPLTEFAGDPVETCMALVRAL